MIATFSGWMLDGMDVMAYSFALPTLVSLWQLSPSQAGALATSALIVSSLGGWLAGVLADQYGRVRILQVTILWFSVFTFLSGCTTSFSQLLVVRGLQGLGFGGEWAVGSVLIAESIGAAYRGRAVGVVQSGWAVGWGLAAACYGIFFSLLPAEAAWRCLFFVGILPALLVLYIRRKVQEPNINLGHSIRRRPHRIFGRGLRQVTALTCLLSVGAQGGYYAIATWLPLYLRDVRRLSVVSTTTYLIVVILGSFIGYLTSAHLTDWLGRRVTLIVFASLSAAVVYFYTSIEFQSGWTMLMGFPLGFFSSGNFSPLGSFFAELFPNDVRGSGQGFSYNFGRAAGAMFPFLVGYLSSRIGLSQAIAIFAVAAYLLMIVSTTLLPETRGKLFD